MSAWARRMRDSLAWFQALILFGFPLPAPPRQCIDLHFEENYSIESSWECKFDNIEVRDGPFGFSPMLGRYCGQHSPPDIRSSGRYLWIKFVTDGELEAVGFSASYNFTAGTSVTFLPCLWTWLLLESLVVLSIDCMVGIFVRKTQSMAGDCFLLFFFFFSPSKCHRRTGAMWVVCCFSWLEEVESKLIGGVKPNVVCRDLQFCIHLVFLVDSSSLE